MATVRVRQHATRTTYAVRFRMGGRGSRETTVTWGTRKEADKFCALVNAVGGARAMEIHGIDDATPRPHGVTVREFLHQHVESLTGVEKKTRSEYRRYTDNDLAPLGEIPLEALSRADVAGWVNGLQGSGKTIQNKLGFLSGSLRQAVKDGKISSNPCEGIRLPRTERREMVFLTREEYHLLWGCFSEHYRPLVDFLVASGCRFSEATALRQSDVDRVAGTVSISRSWKHVPGSSWELGAPKTRRSVRTITVPANVIPPRDGQVEWLFVNTRGKPVYIYGWRENVWGPAVRKAQARGLAKRPRVHDLRHTCASWMIAAGVDLVTIQRHLGHESIKTTVDSYGHLENSAARKAASAIADLLTR